MPARLVDCIVRGGAADAATLGRSAIARWTAETEPDDALNELLYVDARMSLADDLLIIGDHCAMRSSVELRVPFLDLRLLELIERMPGRFKLSLLGSRKWLYRQAAMPHLPPIAARQTRGVTWRLRRKQGFSTPIARWSQPNGGFLADPDPWAGPLYDHPLLDAAALRGVLASNEAGPRQRSLLYAFATWLERHEQRAPQALEATYLS
jgi:asparagine synthase (glutamine-hydrolysing)